MKSHPAPSTEQMNAIGKADFGNSAIDRPQTSARSVRRFVSTVLLLNTMASGLAAVATVLPGSAYAQTRSPNSGTSTTTPVRTPPNGTTATAPRFSCQQSGNDYTVVYNPMTRNGQSYPWAKPAAMGGGWTVDRRCFEIARRLEDYRPDGLLEMQTSTENGYNIICVTTEANRNCRIVLTIPPGQNVLETRNRVFSNLTIADSGQQTNAVNTFTGEDNGILHQIGDAIGVDLSGLTGDRGQGSSGSSSSSVSADTINLRPFLDPSDGGTGEQL